MPKNLNWIKIYIERERERNPSNPMLTPHSPYLEKKLYYIYLEVVFRFLFSPVNITRVFILYKSYLMSLYFYRAILSKTQLMSSYFLAIEVFQKSFLSQLWAYTLSMKLQLMSSSFGFVFWEKLSSFRLDSTSFYKSYLIMSLYLY